MRSGAVCVSKTKKEAERMTNRGAQMCFSSFSAAGILKFKGGENEREKA